MLTPRSRFALGKKELVSKLHEIITTLDSEKVATIRAAFEERDFVGLPQLTHILRKQLPWQDRMTESELVRSIVQLFHALDNNFGASLNFDDFLSQIGIYLFFFSSLSNPTTTRFARLWALSCRERTRRRHGLIRPRRTLVCASVPAVCGRTSRASRHRCPHRAPPPARALTPRLTRGNTHTRPNTTTRQKKRRHTKRQQRSLLLTL